MANAKFRKLAVSDVGSVAWEAYERAKQAYKTYKALRDEAEELAREALPALPSGVAYVFTYNYGNWSVFLGEPAERKATAAPKVNLADWVQQQANGGRAV